MKTKADLAIWITEAIWASYHGVSHLEWRAINKFIDDFLEVNHLELVLRSKT